MVNAFFILSNYKMKKITLFVCALCLAFTEISAQVFIGDNTEGISSTNSTPQTQTNAPSGQETTDSKKKYKDITDVTFEFNTDVNIYGFNMGDDHYHLGMIFGDDLFGVTFGYGLGKTYVFDDTFLIKGRLYPYIGICNDFLWGAAANVDVGLRLWKTKKGSSGFITFGYNVTAPELKTSGMVENGEWVVGISVVSW